MKRNTIKITDKQKWLELRANDITSTDVSSLFKCNPYATKLELFYRKRDKEAGEFKTSERMEWGNKLEALIAEKFADDYELAVAPLKDYITVPELKIGSSFDYRIIDESRGDGILEIKNVDSLIYKNNWTEDENGIQAPFHIELQLQHQLLVSELQYGYIVALVGGNTLKVAYRDRDEAVIERIQQECADFWNDVEADKAPQPSYPEDADVVIARANKADSEKSIDAKDNIDLQLAIDAYEWRYKNHKKMADELKQRKAEILDLIGDASKVFSEKGKFACGLTKESKGKLVTQDMVGTYINPRKAFRNFRFTPVTI